ncbi:hypothetical protein ZHAS_00021599 [Anopheles sinensis]|uniref:Uncharacterized protein n=1 Tax=Anopheles sinensis TaxID=74873 RepID=A0A084WSV0_ANOSI|nr:hypothetical protein ZHAS_00021599 [Anopheles sinensis]
MAHDGVFGVTDRFGRPCVEMRAGENICATTPNTDALHALMHTPIGATDCSRETYRKRTRPSGMRERGDNGIHWRNGSESPTENNPPAIPSPHFCAHSSVTRDHQHGIHNFCRTPRIGRATVNPSGRAVFGYNGFLSARRRICRCIGCRIGEPGGPHLHRTEPISVVNRVRRGRSVNGNCTCGLERTRDRVRKLRALLGDVEGFGFICRYAFGITWLAFS